MAVKRYTWQQRDTLPAVHRAVALGVFDGLHIGHRAVLSAVCGVIDEDGMFLTATALSMTGAPKHSTGRLLTAQREKQLFDTLGTDEWIEMPFEAVCELSPERFVKEILRDLLQARIVCCGENYRFGKNGVATVHTLRTLCEPLGIRVMVIDMVQRDGADISSTRVREAIAAGDMTLAERLLGRPFSVELPVTNGDHRGRQWGIPTLNQVFPADYVVPRYGVYASLVVVGDRQYHAVTNIGVHPTVGGAGEPQAETWIQDFDGELYGQNVRVLLIRFLREERHFADIETLKAQIATDVDNAQTLLNGQNGEKAVLFDFDDTLQDRTQAFLAAMRKLLSRHMHAVDEQQREQYAHQMWLENGGGYVDYNAFFQGFIDRWPFDEGVTLEQILWEYHRIFPESSVLFPETPAVLEEIRRKGYRIGIVTNGLPLVQNRKLDLTGLRLCIDMAVVSDDEGVKKPHPELFLRAAARLGVAPENCIFVGDHPVNDVQGATSARMPAIYLNTRGLDEHPEGVPEVHQLKDILNML